MVWKKYNERGQRTLVIGVALLVGCLTGCGWQDVAAGEEAVGETIGRDLDIQSEVSVSEPETSVPESDAPASESVASVPESDASVSEPTEELQSGMTVHAEFDENYDFGPMAYDLTKLPAMENKLYAEWDGRIYYRQYSGEDMEEGGLWADFAPIAYARKELMCIEPDGSVVQVGIDYGCDAMFIVNGRLYSQRYVKQQNQETGYEEGDYRVYSCELDGSDAIEYTSTEVLAVRGNRVICNAKPGLVYIDTLTGQEHILLDQDAVYLDADEEKIFCCYYPRSEENDYDVTVCSLDYEGNLHELKTVTREEYADCVDMDVGMLVFETRIGIPCFKMIGDDLYFSAGTYNGTGSIYTGGPIYSMKKDGSECRIETTSYEQNFYLYDDGVSRALYFASADDGTPIGEDGLRRINLYGEEQNIILRMPYTPYDDPYVYTVSDPKAYPNGDSVVVYPDTSGICYVLLTMQESEELAIRTQVDGRMVQQIDGVEYLDGKLFFTVTDLIYSEEYSLGWRDGYERGRSVCYCKDVESGEIRQLYEY